MVAYSSGHRRRDAERFMDAAEVAEREPYCGRGPVVLPLFGKAFLNLVNRRVPILRDKFWRPDNRGADAFKDRVAP